MFGTWIYTQRIKITRNALTGKETIAVTEKHLDKNKVFNKQQSLAFLVISRIRMIILQGPHLRYCGKGTKTRTGYNKG